MRRREGRPRHDLYADDPGGDYGMLACARIGAVHSVVFGGFSPDSLAGRIEDCHTPTSSSLPTKACAAAAKFRSRPIPTRPLPKVGRQWIAVDHVIVVRRTGATRRHESCATSIIDDVAESRDGRLSVRARSTRKTRSSFSIRQARPASPRASCTPPAVTRLVVDDASLRLRLSRRRCLLVHRRCRLGHRS